MTDAEALKNTLYIVAAILVHRHLPPFLSIAWGAGAYIIALLIVVTT